MDEETITLGGGEEGKERCSEMETHTPSPQRKNKNRR